VTAKGPSPEHAPVSPDINTIKNRQALPFMIKRPFRNATPSEQVGTKKIGERTATALLPDLDSRC
jgi:hypothetical protein